MKPLPFRWQNSEHATFDFKESTYGILISYLTLEIVDSHRPINVANIAFGVLKSNSFKTEDDLDLNLTGGNMQRTVFSTVAAACLSNKSVVDSDVICLGSSDKVKDKRSLLYSLALSEIKNKEKSFASRNDIRVKTSNGTILNLLSRIEFSAEQKEEVAEKLGLTKV